MRNTFLFFTNHPVCGTLLGQPKLTKMFLELKNIKIGNNGKSPDVGKNFLTTEDILPPRVPFPMRALYNQVEN